MIIIYTGDGKGKTTAALGLAFRAAGWNQKVAIIQFIKGYKNIGEWKIIKRIPEIDIFQSFDDKIMAIGKPEEKHSNFSALTLKLAKKIIRMKKYDVVILDEINNAISHNLVEVGEIVKLLTEKPAELTVVLTGRNAPKKLIDLADTVTEMKKHKHIYDKGVSAKKGIDF